MKRFTAVRSVLSYLGIVYLVQAGLKALDAAYPLPWWVLPVALIPTLAVYAAWEK